MPTEIEDRTVESIWDGEKRIARIEADIHAETNDRDDNHTAVDAVERVRDAVKREVQAIQDEMDTGSADE